jgi:hypothetical protein
MVAKRHHYVPRGYLQAWCDESGKLYVYRKDDPARLIHQSPDATAFHKHYYSQPLPNGNRDNALEEFFSELESAWPPIVNRISKRDDVNDALATIFEFVSLQLVRVPAQRDATEKKAAAQLRAELFALDAAGLLPPKPEEHPDILDNVEVAIDPHHSIHAMPSQLRETGKLLDRLGLTILHNTTTTRFLTSDNPVAYFDPAVAEDALRPYDLTSKGDVILLFPISPSLMLFGDSRLRQPLIDRGLHHADLNDAELVHEMNKVVCRFAYTAVFSLEQGCEALVRRYADKSPVVKSKIIAGRNGDVLLHESHFGKREPKPKWTR